MLRRLSVLPLLFIIFFVFAAADIGFSNTTPSSSHRKSPTVPPSAYDRKFPLSPSHKYYSSPSDSASISDRRNPSISNKRKSGSFTYKKRTMGYPAGKKFPGRLEQFHTGSIDSVKRNDNPGIGNPGILDSANTDYKPSLLDPKVNNLRIRPESYSFNFDNFNIFKGPVSADFAQQSRRREIINNRLKQLSSENDPAVSLEVKTDVNRSRETDGQNEDLWAKLRQIPEPQQIEKPLTPEEVRQKLSEIFAKERSADNLNQKQDKHKKDKTEDTGKDAYLANLLNQNETREGTGKDKQLASKTAAERPDPLDGVTPGNIQMKLERTRELLGDVNDLDTFTSKRFTEYFDKADDFFAKREYRNALDCYGIASAWNDQDPRPYVRSALAHLALGEYLSSSTSLIKAIEVSPEYAAKKLDIPELIGNKKYDRHLTTLKDMFKVRGDYKTMFLLSYLYTQKGDYKDAKECLDAAKTKMTETKVWNILNTELEKNIKIPQD